MAEKKLCTLKNMNFIIEVATPPILRYKPHVWSFAIIKNKSKVLYKIVTNRKRKMFILDHLPHVFSVIQNPT